MCRERNLDDCGVHSILNGVVSALGRDVSTIKYFDVELERNEAKTSLRQVLHDMYRYNYPLENVFNVVTDTDVRCV